MFKNREEAGQKLAEQLSNLIIGQSSSVVLAIPRGGVVIGKILSENFGCPLSVLVVKKIGAPGNPELAVGAMGPDGKPIWNMVIRELGIETKEMDEEIRKLRFEVEERIRKYNIKSLILEGKTVILTDDGIATGATAEAAIAWIKAQKPKKIILAVPVAPPEVAEKLKSLVSKLIVLETPSSFQAVGQFYEEFPQISDEDVVKLLLDAIGSNKSE